MGVEKIAFIILALVCSASASVFAQMPDCGNPASNSDKLICTDGGACDSQNGMSLQIYSEHIEEFYKGSEKSPDRPAIEAAQKDWLEKRTKCGEGGDLKETKFRFQVHECLCKILHERFTKLRFAKRDASGAPAEKLIEFLKTAEKTEIPRTLEAQSVYCLTEGRADPGVTCTLTDKQDKHFFLSGEKAVGLREHLKAIGFGSVFGGLGRQGQEILRVKCTKKGSKPATCAWECDQSKGD